MEKKSLVKKFLSQEIMRFFFAFMILFLFSGMLRSQDNPVKLEEISTIDQFEEAMDILRDKLGDAVDEEGILSTLSNIAKLKCYFPLGDYSDLYDDVKDHKKRGITADVKFTAATVAKFINYPVTPSIAMTLLSITDQRAFIDKIGEYVY